MSAKTEFLGAWEYISIVILYCMMTGLSSSLQLSAFKDKLKNPQGVLVTMSLQFLVMPFFCWLLSVIFSLNENATVALITVGCCPGGALSNVLCYMFKADVTLSIAMTSCSSLVSIGMLPLNCFIYIKLAGNVSLNYDWVGMIITTAVVILGTLSGLFISTKYPQYAPQMERFARVNMWIIIIGTIAVNNLSGGGLFRKAYPAAIYIVSILPSMFGCAYALGITTLLQLPKPSRLAVAVECGLQNQILALGILTLTIKDTEARAEAYSIPILYAAFSILFYLCFLGFFLRQGWTESKSGTTMIGLIIARLKQRQRPPEEIEKQSLNEGDDIKNQITTTTSTEVVVRTELEMQSTTSIEKLSQSTASIEKFSPKSEPQEAKSTMHSDPDAQEQDD